MDFESLVKGTASPAPSATATAGLDPWDERWPDATEAESALVSAWRSLRSSLNVQSQMFQSSTGLAPSTFAGAASPSLDGPSALRFQPAQQSRLNARPVPASSFKAALFGNTPTSSLPPQSSTNAPLQPAKSAFAPMQPTSSSFAPLQPTPRSAIHPPTETSSGAPNYNISLAPSAPSPRPQQQPPMSFMSPPPQQQRPSPSPSLPTHAPARPPPGYSSGLMQPTIRPKPSVPTVNGNQDWGDFDPLK